MGVGVGWNGTGHWAMITGYTRYKELITVYKAETPPIIQCHINHIVAGN